MKPPRHIPLQLILQPKVRVKRRKSERRTKKARRRIRTVLVKAGSMKNN
jgi:hypothetical protein